MLSNSTNGCNILMASFRLNSFEQREDETRSRVRTEKGQELVVPGVTIGLTPPVAGVPPQQTANQSTVTPPGTVADLSELFPLIVAALTKCACKVHEARTNAMIRLNVKRFSRGTREKTDWQPRARTRAQIGE